LADDLILRVAIVLGIRDKLNAGLNREINPSSIETAVTTG
jgi:hypothetical protein